MNLFDSDASEASSTSAGNERRDYLDGLAGPGFYDALKRAEEAYHRTWHDLDEYRDHRSAVILLGVVAGAVVALMVWSKVWWFALVAIVVAGVSVYLARRWQTRSDRAEGLEVAYAVARARYFRMQESPWELGEEAA